MEYNDIAIAPLIGRKSGFLIQFEAQAVLLIERYYELRNLDCPPERPNDWFKRNAYRMLKAYIDASATSVFDRAIARSGRSTVGLEAIRSNAFKLGLYAIYADNSQPRNDRQIFGNQMLYAHRHGVEPEHFVGFIRAAGAPLKIAFKLREGSREPGFE